MRALAYLLAGSVLLTGAGNATAAPDTGQILGDTANDVLVRTTNCYVSYRPIVSVIVYNPLSPSNALVVVSVPQPYQVTCYYAPH